MIVNGKGELGETSKKKNLLKNSLEFNNKASPRSKQTKKKNNF